MTAPAHSMSLFDIETQLAELVEFKESAQDPEERDAAEKQIQEYLKLEIRKVDGVARYIRNEEAAADVIAKEIVRLKDRMEAHRTRAQWLKNLTLEVMRLVNEKKLAGEFNTLRRHDNPERLVITSPDLIPSQFCSYGLTLDHQQYRDLLIALAASPTGLTLKPYVEKSTERAPINSAVKSELKSGAHVPGARLERDEHLRLA